MRSRVSPGSGRWGYAWGPSATPPAGAEDLLWEHVDFVGSSARWGVEKPAPAFFERMVVEAGYEPDEVAYVGDRIDNDVLPAAEAGLVPIHVRRGPWGMLQEEGAARHLCIGRLSELPEFLHGL